VRRLVVETTEGIELDFELAGAGSRAAAALFDFFVCVVTLLGLLLVAVTVAQVDPTGLSRFLLGLLLGGGLLSLTLYQVLLPQALDGRTPGKALLGLRVLDAEGAPASFRQHLLRGLFFVLDAFLLLPAPIGLVLVAASRRHQRLGDVVAGTLVVRDEQALERGEPFARERWSALPARRLALGPAAAARLDASDRSYLRRLLGASGLDPEARARILVASARHYARRLDLQPGAPEPARGRWGTEPEARQAAAFLREVYLFLRETQDRRGD
jgi:uncharacterized RDD family membrane protein YckC